MPLTLQSFSTIAEARKALQGDGMRYLGGGTLAVRAANEGSLSFHSLVRSSDRSLKAITVKGGSVSIGASVTMAEVVAHRALKALAKAARSVGGPAIRNMATVGGNLFAEAPYGDFAVALLALDAEVVAGRRKFPLQDFLAGRAQYRDIVTAVTLDLPEAEDFRFVKVTRIKPKGSSVITIAAHLETSPDGLVKSARIALGCMAKTPMRAVQAERALRGARLTEQGIAAAVAVVAEATAAITDAVASSWYRREVLPVHFRRLLLAPTAA